MGLYLVGSAKGSPGATTTATALAATWAGDAVLADLDPAGGDVALRYRGPSGGPLDTDRGLLSLGAALRRGRGDVEVGRHLQRVGGGLDVLTGVSAPEQVAGLAGAWPHVAAALSELPGRDVVGDLGRLGADAPAAPLLAAADAVLLVTRPGLEDVAHLRERLRALAAPMHLRTGGGVPVAVAVITSDRDRHTPRDLARLLADADLPVAAVTPIADDPRAARALREGGSRRLASSMLLRSVREVGEELRSLAAARRAMSDALG
jgi:MinD-like ATPase involved in chromosome partitioning or flagellar assembly